MAKWKSLSHFWSSEVEFLNDMALFVEVVKAKSFRRAAEAIGVPNSTLSRRISALEKAIGNFHGSTCHLNLGWPWACDWARNR